MMAKQTGLALVLVLFTVGCVDASTEPRLAETDANPAASVSAQSVIGTNQGAIRGTVTNDEIVPLVNATVAVKGLDTSALTGPDGGYVLVELPPGDYRISASAANHSTLARDVTVYAGMISHANFTLAAEPVSGPYVAVYLRTGHLDFSHWTADQLLLGTLNQTCTQCRLVLRLDDAPVQYMHEFLFDSTNPLPSLSPPQICWHLHRNTTADYGLQTPGHIFSGCTPNRGSQGLGVPRIQPWDRQLTLYLTGPEAAPPTVNQRVDAWFSIAHGGFLPSGWTALPPE